jgi:hypothetical protein
MRTYEESVFNSFRMRTCKKYSGWDPHTFTLPPASGSCYSQLVIRHPRSRSMEWTTPTHEEIDLSCEISSYANAEL